MAGRIRNAINRAGVAALASGFGAKAGSSIGRDVATTVVPLQTKQDGYDPITNPVTKAVIDHVPHMVATNADQVAQASQIGHGVGATVGALVLGGLAIKAHRALRPEQFGNLDK